MIEWLSQPWPWYVAGPLIGLMVPALLLLDNRTFGISSSYQHACAALLPGRITLPGRTDYFDYDWKRNGGRNLALALGILLGGFLAGWFLTLPEPIDTVMVVVLLSALAGTLTYGYLEPRLPH